MSEPKTVSPDDAGAQAQKQPSNTGESSSGSADSSGMISGMIPDINRFHILLLVFLAVVAFFVYRTITDDSDEDAYEPRNEDVQDVQRDVNDLENGGDGDEEEDDEIDLSDADRELEADDKLAETVF